MRANLLSNLLAIGLVLGPGSSMSAARTAESGESRATSTATRLERRASSA